MTATLAQPADITSKWMNDNLTEVVGGNQVLRTTATLSGDITVPLPNSTSVGYGSLAYTSSPATSAAYVQVIAASGAQATSIEIFDSSGQIMVLAFGASGHEVNQFLIVPGGNGRMNYLVPTGTRVSVIALSSTASVGNLIVNLYS